MYFFFSVFFLWSNTNNERENFFVNEHCAFALASGKPGNLIAGSRDHITPHSEITDLGCLCHSFPMHSLEVIINAAYYHGLVNPQSVNKKKEKNSIGDPQKNKRNPCKTIEALRSKTPPHQLPRHLSGKTFGSAKQKTPIGNPKRQPIKS